MLGTYNNNDVRFDPFDIEEFKGVIFGIYGYIAGEIVNTEIEYPDQWFTSVIVDGKPSAFGVITDAPREGLPKAKSILPQLCLTPTSMQMV